jgi:hypothetical protein
MGGRVGDVGGLIVACNDKESQSNPRGMSPPHQSLLFERKYDVEIKQHG